MLFRLATSALAISLLVANASGQSLTGHIVDYNGAPVNNVNVILSNGAPLGTTDASGNFLITGLRNRVYTIQLDPHTDFLAAQQFDFSVSGAATLGTIVLGPAFPLSATFIGPAGTGLLGVNMNAYLANGTKLYSPHDGTDALGNVAIGIPANTPVVVRAVPPVGTTLVPWETTITLSAPQAAGTITLRQGFTVSGTVVDAVIPTGIAGCELVTTNLLTGEVVTQLNKLTNALGAFQLLLPFGLYQIDILPPLGNLHFAKQIFGLPVTSFAHNLGFQQLSRAVVLSGIVQGPGGTPVNLADIDIYTADNYKLFTPHDNTGPTGLFSILVPPGSYSVRVDPPTSYGLVGTRTGNFTVNTNTSVGIIGLQAGVTMDLNVVDFANNPVNKANVNFTNPVTGEQVVIAGDFSDATGHVHGIVPLGNWNMSIAAPAGSLAATVKFNNTPVVGPISTTIVMPKKVIMSNVTGLGILTIANGGAAMINWTVANTDPLPHTVWLDAYTQLPDGSILPWIPYIGLDLPPAFQITLPEIWLPMPPVPANQLGRLQRFVVRLSNPANGQPLDEAYIHYVPL